MTMRTVTCWYSPVPYSGVQTQARLLAPHFHALGLDVQAAPHSEMLLPALVEMRRASADVVHLAGLTAMRRFFLCGRWQRPPVIVSLRGNERVTRFDKWCLARVARLVVPYPAAISHFTAQGVTTPMVVIPPCVVAPPAISVQEVRRSHGIPADGVVLFAAGSFHRPHELTDAVWAYEILRYTSARYHLFVVGDGPERARAEAFAHNLAPEGTRVHFVGLRDDVSVLVQVADVVLVPSCSGGLTFALEAMAAGRAVIGYRTPALASVLQHEHNGLLVELRNKPDTAKAFVRLVQDTVLRERLGTAAQATATTYTIERATAAWHTVYTLS